MSTSLPSWMVLESTGWDDEEPEKITSYSFYKDSPEGEVILYYDDAAHAYYRFDADGKRVDVPGVTTVLKDVGPSKPLMIWAVKLAINTIREGLKDSDGRLKSISTEDLEILLEDAKTKHDQELREAGDVGHVVHALLEKAIKLAIAETDGVMSPIGNLPPDDRVVNATNAALEWTQSHKVKFIFTERKIYSKDLDIAGTGDGLAWVSSCDDSTCCKEFYVDRLAFIDWKTSRSMRTTYILQTAAYRFAYIEETSEPVTDTWILKLNKETGKLQALHRGPETFEMELNAFLSALNLYRDMDTVEDSLSAQKAVQRVARKAIKDEQKAVKEAALRVEKAQAKAAKMEATRLRNEAKDRLYKKLRNEGMSASDAKAQVALEYPTLLRNVRELLDELPEERRQKIEERAQEIISAPVIKPTDPDLEWSISL